MGSSRNALTTIAVVALTGASACTMEQQNKLSRGIQNWTGTNGVLDIYAGDKLIMRFIKIDKMTTGTGTSDNGPRAPIATGMGTLTKTSTTKSTPEKRKFISKSATIRPTIYFTRITNTELPLRYARCTRHSASTMAKAMTPPSTLIDIVTRFAIAT